MEAKKLCAWFTSRLLDLAQAAARTLMLWCCPVFQHCHWAYYAHGGVAYLHKHDAAVLGALLTEHPGGCQQQDNHQNVGH